MCLCLRTLLNGQKKIIIIEKWKYWISRKINKYKATSLKTFVCLSQRTKSCLYSSLCNRMKSISFLPVNRNQAPKIAGVPRYLTVHHSFTISKSEEFLSCNQIFVNSGKVLLFKSCKLKLIAKYSHIISQAFEISIYTSFIEKTYVHTLTLSRSYKYLL